MLKHYICQSIDELQDQEALQIISQLRIGTKVMFEGNHGPVASIVSKIDRKSVIVVGYGMKQHMVSPGVIRPLKDVK